MGFCCRRRQYTWRDNQLSVSGVRPAQSNLAAPPPVLGWALLSAEGPCRARLPLTWVCIPEARGNPSPCSAALGVDPLGISFDLKSQGLLSVADTAARGITGVLLWMGWTVNSLQTFSAMGVFLQLHSEHAAPREEGVRGELLLLNMEA